MLQTFLEAMKGLWEESGLMAMTWQNAAMIALSFFFMFLAIKKQYEPLLLLPISFGMFLANLPLANLAITTDGSGVLLDVLYLGVKHELFPPLIFLGIGCMTDFGPLIANPKSFLLGAAAQGGIFFAFIGAAMLGMTPPECASIAIIGGADGPTAIYVSSQMLANRSWNGIPFELSVGTIAVAAYSYMALVPVIQPPIMKLLTTKKERMVVMGQLRTVSKTEKIIFPIAVTLVVCLVPYGRCPTSERRFHRSRQHLLIHSQTLL